MPDYSRMANETLRAARKAKKLTLEALAADIGISVSQLSRIERGEREARFAEVQKIAERLGLGVADLVDGADEGDTVPVVGYVGAGAEMSFFAEGQGEIDRVKAPEGSTKKTVATIIRGTSLGELFDRWLVYYDQIRTPPTSDMIGTLCVVGLADGRTLVKKLQRGQMEDTYTLISNTEPPIYDAEVDWAARVNQMSPR
jgi:transcriptional regulator with XRE-family HTH domain